MFIHVLPLFPWFFYSTQDRDLLIERVAIACTVGPDLRVGSGGHM